MTGPLLYNEHEDLACNLNFDFSRPDIDNLIDVKIKILPVAARWRDIGLYSFANI